MRTHPSDRQRAPRLSGTGDGGAAFTLFELMVVAGLMAVLAAMLGWALRAPGDAAALRAGQTALAGLCDAARGGAILHGATVRLLVVDDPDEPDGCLRVLQVVREDPENPGCWLSCGAGVSLPKSVYVVPPPPAVLPGGADWPTSHRSTALSTTAPALTVDGVSAGRFRHVQFTDRGTTAGGTILLTVARPTAVSPAFDRPDLVRGVLLRSTGMFTALNEVSALVP